MQAALRVITQLPLEKLWRGDGFSTSSRGGWLGADQIQDVLRVGRVQFVVADVGSEPRWIAPEESYQFWKSEVKPHLATPDLRVHLEQFPDAYAYFASAWGDDSDVPIIVLERHH